MESSQIMASTVMAWKFSKASGTGAVVALLATLPSSQHARGRCTSVCCNIHFPGTVAGAAKIFGRSLIDIVPHAEGTDAYHSACKQTLSHPPHNQLAAHLNNDNCLARKASSMNYMHMLASLLSAVCNTMALPYFPCLPEYECSDHP